MYLKPLHLPKDRILVLEGDRTLRAGLRGLLTGAGYALAEREDGAIGTGRIDLVLAGIGAHPKPRVVLQGLDRAAPVILLVDRAAWTYFNFFDAANELGAVAALQRPCSRAALLGLVTRVLSDARRGAEPDGGEDRNAERPDLQELLLQLENPNFA
jgi:DNA-binding response OmpR family regulator